MLLETAVIKSFLFDCGLFRFGAVESSLGKVHSIYYSNRLRHKTQLIFVRLLIRFSCTLIENVELSSKTRGVNN